MMLQTIDWSGITDFFVYDPQRPLLFNSAGFFVLFVLFYGGYLLLLRRFNLRLVYTLAFSLYFYYLCSGFFFLLLVVSTIIDFALGHFIYRASGRRSRLFFLWLSIAANLGMLGYFKYTHFFVDTANAVTGVGWDLEHIFLPVGISFFTFQTMSYSIDIYRGHLVPLTEEIRGWGSFFSRLLDFAFFVSFFPQLVAGPIVRAAGFIPQIRRRLELSDRELGRAFLLILGGLFKKAVISDFISVNFVDRVFESPMLYSGFENLLATYGYAIQIYCDFSGYSDMAIGLALLLGFRLPENFRKPYRAESVRDFWRRWHISLSTWLRDYLYISLGGNRRGSSRTYVNLMITMVLGGLWHGASWVFILWGGLHGIALVIDRYLREQGQLFDNPAIRALFVIIWAHLMGIAVLFCGYLLGYLPPTQYMPLLESNLFLGLLWVGLVFTGIAADALIRRLGGKIRFAVSKRIAVVLIFHFVCLCWIFFRSGSLQNPVPPMQTTAQILTQTLTAFQPDLIPQVLEGYRYVALLIGVGFILHYLPNQWQAAIERRYAGLPWFAQSFSLAFIVWLVIQTSSSGVVPFIYFQF
jgi:alginate O-acetyltransferase complex protein AlgI